MPEIQPRNRKKGAKIPGRRWAFPVRDQCRGTGNRFIQAVFSRSILAAVDDFLRDLLGDHGLSVGSDVDAADGVIHAFHGGDAGGNALAVVDLLDHVEELGADERVALDGAVRTGSPGNTAKTPIVLQTPGTSRKEVGAQEEWV